MKSYVESRHSNIYLIVTHLKGNTSSSSGEGRDRTSIDSSSVTITPPPLEPRSLRKIL